MRPNYIYKVLRMDEWMSLREVGEFYGSDDDRRDGYIHLSTRKQLAGTLEKYYTQGDMIILAEVDATDAEFLSDLKWEVARDGSEFPHLYSELSIGDVLRFWELTPDAQGRYELPI
ncbi:DUF952 domain-containing protein [Litorimonas sp. RW-G-Af-16]|uniref:DUF952 domain-containing protein n=1 Tax=Litorimonas sp. RW-G-Af-16 TaxID=3241168 RepID=UPI00390CAF0D